MNKLISYLVIVLSGLILSTTASQAASILLTSTEIELLDPEPPPGENLETVSGGVSSDPDSGSSGLNSEGVSSDPDPGGNGLATGEPATIPETVPVPEPLTIIGSATALGWGALLKRESSKNKNKS